MMSVFHSSKSFSSRVLGAVCSSVASMRSRLGRCGVSAVRCWGHRGDGTSAAATAASASDRRMLPRRWQCNLAQCRAAQLCYAGAAQGVSACTQRVVARQLGNAVNSYDDRRAVDQEAAVQCLITQPSLESSHASVAVQLTDCSPIGVMRGVLRAMAAKITEDPQADGMRATLRSP